MDSTGEHSKANTMSDTPRDETEAALESLSAEMDRALARAQEVLGQSRSTWAQSAAVLAAAGLDVPQPTAWPRAIPLVPKKKPRKQRMAI